MSARIFEHLDGAPEDRRFSKIAHAMRNSRWWSTVPVYVAPVAVSGEVQK